MFTKLANVKAFKNITEDQHDEELSRLIPVVQAFVETYCERTFELTAGLIDYITTEPGQRRVLLRRPPVTTITSIYDDPLRAYGASTLVAATDYVVTNAEAGILEFTRDLSEGGLNNLKVTYSGGYAAGSQTLALMEQAAMELIWLARDKGDQALLGLSSRSIADSSIVVRNDWPAGVQTILDLHRLQHG
jgi:hypothetical protein